MKNHGIHSDVLDTTRTTDYNGVCLYIYIYEKQNKTACTTWSTLAPHKHNTDTLLCLFIYFVDIMHLGVGENVEGRNIIYYV